MGVKFNREYNDIVDDIVIGIRRINNCYEAFEMDAGDWNALDDSERTDCLRTLADDLFFGLGSFPEMRIGSGKIEYDRTNHILKITSAPQIVHLIHLI